MSNNGDTQYKSLFSSLISDIKSYNGNDPLLPWLRGIKKMKEALPPQLLKEKLPRFLQKCSETFLTDRRYSNDLRYLRVWLQLMDSVDDPKAVLKTMEMNHIGIKKSLFYQAYALYYEKKKKFDAAEKIYHLGVQNLAEPADELQKSYDQFLCRMERHRNKRVQRQRRNTNITSSSAGSIFVNLDKVRGCNDNLPRTEGKFLEAQANFVNIENVKDLSQGRENDIPTRDPYNFNMPIKSSDLGFINNHFQKVAVSNAGVKNCYGEVKMEKDENPKFCSDDTVVVKFVDSAIVGKSNAEDARHHGLVEPTINTKEAMNAINNMFKEPLESSNAGRRRVQNQFKTGSSMNNGVKVFTDKSLENELGSLNKNLSKDPSVQELKISEGNQSLGGAFEIYIDGQETNDVEELVNKKDNKVQTGYVFAKPNDLHSECSKDPNSSRAHQSGLGENTIVNKFVGSTISDEPEVENAWHHGLVDPTINLKEAMKDINNMFGKPIEYARKSRSRKQDNGFNVNTNSGEFLIYPDDELENQKAEDDINCMFQKPLDFAKKSSPRKQNEVIDRMENHTGFLILPDDDLDNQQEALSTKNNSDLFEQTLCTKEAIDEINKLFAMPMDF
ncbi:hypothetical protein ACJIZ3_022360 [Penstemon smallii]|uniref:BUB1 N-terminal domain-containing protein n=1 Tax=Penstemon smallii TaxID=265156 RepID=A0ABD3TL28_9LAMI